jgi:hypothetical protein
MCTLFVPATKHRRLRDPRERSPPASQPADKHSSRTAGRAGRCTYLSTASASGSARPGRLRKAPATGASTSSSSGRSSPGAASARKFRMAARAEPGAPLPPRRPDRLRIFAYSTRLSTHTTPGDGSSGKTGSDHSIAWQHQEADARAHGSHICRQFGHTTLAATTTSCARASTPLLPSCRGQAVQALRTLLPSVRLAVCVYMP